MKKALLFTLLIFIFSCRGGINITIKDGQLNGIIGNEKITSKKRTVENFDKISVNGSLKVVLTSGKEGEILIEGDENIISNIETIVSGDLLKIKMKDNTYIKYYKKLVIYVAFEDIHKISLKGSGDIICKKEISANNVTINLTGSGDIKTSVNAINVFSKLKGSGDITIKGHTENYNCTVIGSGDIKSYGLKSKTTTAKISGSGDIKTTTTQEIKATINGSGDIRYKGNPQVVNSKVNGSGDITAY